MALVDNMSLDNINNNNEENNNDKKRKKSDEDDEANAENYDNGNNKRIKISKGRQKIEIKKIEKETNLEVAFSKRRKGLFNKAGELCVLCGAEIAILVISPHGRPYSFAHPDMNLVVSRYLNPETIVNDRNSLLVEGSSIVHELNMECEYALRMLEGKKKKYAEEKAKICDEGFWWDYVNIEELERDELEDYVKAMEKLQTNVKEKHSKIHSQTEEQ